MTGSDVESYSGQEDMIHTDGQGEVPTFKQHYSIDPGSDIQNRRGGGFHSSIGRKVEDFAHNPQPPLSKPVKPTFERSKTAHLSAFGKANGNVPLPTLSRTSSAVSTVSSTVPGHRKQAKSRASNFFKKLTSRKSSLASAGELTESEVSTLGGQGSGIGDELDSIKQHDAQAIQHGLLATEVLPNALRRKMSTFIHGPSSMMSAGGGSPVTVGHIKSSTRGDSLLASNPESRRDSVASSITSASFFSESQTRNQDVINEQSQHGKRGSKTSSKSKSSSNEAPVGSGMDEKFALDLNLNNLEGVTNVLAEPSPVKAPIDTKNSFPSSTSVSNSETNITSKKQWIAPESWDVDETVGLDVNKLKNKHKSFRSQKAHDMYMRHLHHHVSHRSRSPKLPAEETEKKLDESITPHVHHHDFSEAPLSPSDSIDLGDQKALLSNISSPTSTECEYCNKVNEDDSILNLDQTESFEEITTGETVSRPNSPSSQRRSDDYLELDGETEYEEHRIEKYYNDFSSVDQKKKYAIRIFNLDDTFTTLSCSANTTVAELIPQIKKKFGIHQGNFQLSLKVGKLSKILRPTARPILIQLRLLLLNGYKKTDPLHIMGIEDLSFVFNFKFHPVATSQLSIEQQQRLSKSDFIHVDLRNMELTTPPIIFYQHTSEIESLDVSNNANIFLPSDFVESSTKLSSLRMVNVRASRFPVNITEFRNLVSLDLERNFIKRIPESISNLINLTILNLQCNQLEKLPLSFRKLKNLQLLDISSNMFTTYPEVMNNCTNLLQVDLSYNKIRALPESMNQLNKLAKMNLSNNRIESISDLSGMTNLRTLNIKNNRIVNIQSNAQNLQNLFLTSNRITVCEDFLPKLRSVDFTDNPVTSFKYRGGDLSNLTSLSLNKAKLSSFPVEFLKRLQRLEKLELEENNLTYLPEEIGMLKKLIHLSVAKNKLDSIPENISELRNLKSLDLHCNNITQLPVTILSIELTSLNLSSNLISSDSRFSESKSKPIVKTLFFLNLADNRLDDEALNFLSQYRNLKLLNVSYNQFTDLSALDLPRLTELYLSGNNLTTLSGEVFLRMKNLKVLMLNQNKLMSLPAELSQLSNLTVLDVGSNQLKYNISNYHYDWNWMNNVNLKYLNFSGNKRFEIKSMMVPETKRDLSDLTILKNLKVLGLLDVTMKTSKVPDDGVNFRLRTTGTTINGMKYGIADTLGKRESISTRDIKYERFRGRDDECLFCLYDSVNENASSGHRISQIVRDIYDKIFARLLDKYGDDTNEKIRNALRFSFLQLNKEINGMLVSVEDGTTDSELTSVDLLSGTSALVIFIKGKNIFTANIGNISAILAKNNGDYETLSRLHIPSKKEEYERIRIAGGYVNGGKLDGVSEVSRAVGFFDLLPHIHASPDISDFALNFSDQMIIIATHKLWDYIDPETAADIARENTSDPTLAAEKLKDYAIAYGCSDKITVACIGLENGTTDTSHFNLNKKDLMSRKNAFEDTSLRRLQPEIPPPTGNVAIVFTDIKNSTVIWELYPDAMRTAIKTHNDIMRRQLRIFGGYEVKTEGDAFMVAFPTPTSALVWCLSVQLKLLEAEWPGEITSIRDGCLITDDSGNKIYQGLSVRMGIHWGCPVPEVDVVTKRMDYLGPVVNKAARVSGIADGGQVMLSNDFMVEFTKIHRLHKQVIEDKLPLAKVYGEDIIGEVLEREIYMLESIGWTFFELGEQQLKGLETKELVTIAYPKSLDARYTLSSQEQKSNIISNEWLFCLRNVSNRLETILSSVEGGIIGIDGTSKWEYGNFDKKTQISVMKTTSERDSLEFLDHLVTRIESTVAMMTIRQKMLDGLVPLKPGDAKKHKSIYDLLDDLLEKIGRS